METSGGTDQSERTKVDIASINENNLLLPNVTTVTYMRRASSLEGLDFQKNQEKQDRSDVGRFFFLPFSVPLDKVILNDHNYVVTYWYNKRNLYWLKDLTITRCTILDLYIIDFRTPTLPNPTKK